MTPLKPQGIRANTMLSTLTHTPGATGLHVGAVPGEPYGFARELKVTVDLTVDQLPGAHETTDHQTIAAPLNYRMSVEVWEPHEAYTVTTEELDPLQAMSSYTYGEELVSFLAESWERWASNDMHPECAHQDATAPEGIHNPTGWLLANVGWCPVTQYKYGSKWLVEPLEDEFLRDLLSVLEKPIRDGYVFVHHYLPGIAGVEEPA